MNTVAKKSVLQFIQNKRNLFWIFLLLNTLAWAQPTIVTPTPYQVCDDNNDGFAGFELFTKDAEILGTNAPNDYRVTYHTILADAQNDVNEIVSTYTNTVAYNQTVYVRVEENANPSNFATTTLDLIVHDKPIAGNPGDYHLCEQQVGSNTAVFNLTSLNTVIVNGNAMPPHQISFYTTQADAIPGSTINLIGTSATHTVTGTQTIWALLENPVTGCYNVRAVNLIVDPRPIVPASGFFPQLETCETGVPVGIEAFDLTTAIPTILGGQSGISVTFYPSLTDAQNNTSPIMNPAAYTNIVAYTQTLGVVLTNITTGCQSIATMDIRVIDCSTIVFLKDGFLDMSIVAPNTVANVGDIINYTFAAANYSTENFSALSVTDPMLTSITYVSGDTNNDTVFNPNETWVYTGTYALLQSDIDTGFVYNQASVSGVDSNSAPVTSQSTDPTHCYICPNPNQIQGITIVPLNNMVNEGNTNTISGFINYDNGGCATTNSPAAFMPILVQSTTQQFYTYTNADGSYTINVPQGNYTISPQLQWNQPGFVVNPVNTTVNFASNSYLTATQNFCISVASPISDVEVAEYVGNSLRPGFNSDVYIYYRNKGNQVMSGDITFNFDASRMDFHSAYPSTTVSSGVASWSYANLLPGEQRYIVVSLRTHSPTDTIPVNIGNVLPFSVSITPSTDANSSDNSMAFTSTVVGSYDPNNIICTEGDVLPTSEIGDFLHYTVNFENTGNYPADFVNVRIPIDVNLYDVNTLEIEGTSHYFQPKLQNNILDVLFPNIMLDTGGHGNVLLKIKSKNTLQAGDMVSKHAEIFFDYNASVNTGNANTVYQNLATQIITHDNLITVYPNPATSNITITAQNEIQKIELYDVQGRLVLEHLARSEKSINLDISDRATGMYFLKITTAKGSKLEKLVKE